MGADLPDLPEDPRLAALREELDGVDDLPIADRVALLERANAVLAGELAQLDEV